MKTYVKTPPPPPPPLEPVGEFEPNLHDLVIPKSW